MLNINPFTGRNILAEGVNSLLTTDNSLLHQSTCFISNHSQRVIVDESAVTHSNVGEVLRDEPLAVCGARLHILPHGYKFDLKSRKPILNGGSVLTESTMVALC